MIRQYELLERVRAYDKGVDEALLNRAYVYSMKAHGTQVRASGDPYFSHPLEVAGILTQMRLDTVAIATALLHDTIEDTLATYEQIEKTFGGEVAGLVDGVTKLSKIEFTGEGSRQAENFRKLVLAMSDDIRVLLVKLADRLHNMRTLGFIQNSPKRERIALETMEIYAPLAERMGMQKMKDELEDLAFLELNPDARKSVVKRLDFLREKGSDMVGRIIAELEKTLVDNGIGGVVDGREKRPYSIWRKMERNNISFEQLSDIIAFRIIVDDIPRCYELLGVVHTRWSVVPGRFKDYISTPKRNEYRSLHTTVIGPESQRIEIQVRTGEMHEVAELGVAAHWHYKRSDEKPSGAHYRWLRELLEILEHASDPEEFLEHTKLEMFQDQVFCFTPRGDLIALPRGATTVDLAYAVHTQIGDNCVGAKVNGKRVPLRQRLRNGDQVEIITSKAQTPSPTWESFVTTGKARIAIHRFIRHERQSQYERLGKAIAEKAFREAEQEFSEKALRGALEVLSIKSLSELYVALGEGLITGEKLIEAVFPGQKSRRPRRLGWGVLRRKKPKEGAHPVPIKGLIPGLAVHYAECCHPLPGDRIVGIVSSGKGAIVHTIDCELLEAFNDAPERWLDVSWDVADAENEAHVGRIKTTMENEPGALGGLLTTIGDNQANINNLKIVSRTEEFFEVQIDIDVRDVKHLTNIIAAIRADPLVNSVERMRG